MADDLSDGTRAPQPSVAALIVLRDLGESDGKLVIKAALLELVAVDAWKLKEVRRMLRRPLIAFARGSEPVSQRTLLPLLSSAIERSPSVSRRGETLYALEAVVGHLSKTHITPRSIINICLDDLAAAGLVAESTKLVKIGGTSRRLPIRERTDEGEALLGTGARPRPAEDLARGARLPARPAERSQRIRLRRGLRQGGSGVRRSSRAAGKPTTPRPRGGAIRLGLPAVTADLNGNAPDALRETPTRPAPRPPGRRRAPCAARARGA